jgi:hypothetical protein
LSPIRTFPAKSVRSVIVATGSALALSAVVLGSSATSSVALAPSAAARPAVELASVVTPAARHAALTPRQVARRMFGAFHWRPKRQFRFLNLLWDRESSWNVHAQNPWSGAYGIPQAVPGTKMSSAGPNWQNSARTQVLWGLRYIKAVYGKPRFAWMHEVADGWY